MPVSMINYMSKEEISEKFKIVSKVKKSPVNNVKKEVDFP